MALAYAARHEVRLNHVTKALLDGQAMVLLLQHNDRIRRLDAGDIVALGVVTVAHGVSTCDLHVCVENKATR